MAVQNKVSLPVIKRLPKYYRYLTNLSADGKDKISSSELAHMMGTTASQVRQDFNCFGGFGQQGIGYKVDVLRAEIGNLLFGDGEKLPTILVGAGRLASSDDKINESNIRPIWKDEDLYNIKSTIEVDAAATPDQKAKAFIRACIKSRKNYKGSGTPTLYTTEDVLTDCLLLEDLNGRIIYDTEEKLRTALRVSAIVTVPVMEGLKRNDDEGNNLDLMGIIVNLADYNVGADKGGAINMFDDFDIDYNQQKYLIETRCSGALIKPYSAIAIEMVENAAG